MIANVDPSAQVTLTLSANNNGPTATRPIASAGWQPLHFQIAIEGIYDGILFAIAKQGSGTAVLAQLNAQIGSDCGDVPVVQANPALGMTPCTTDTECGSPCYMPPDPDAAPSANSCATCVTSADCVDSMGGPVCGLGPPSLPIFAVPVECITAASKQLGEQCIGDAECDSGICTVGVCSSCGSGSGSSCTAGQECAAEWQSPLGTSPYFGAPWTCAPHKHLQPLGTPCASQDDCQDGICAGTPRMQCDDGRACTTDADCPFGTSDTSNGLQHGPCSNVGTQGGTCQ